MTNERFRLDAPVVKISKDNPYENDLFGDRKPFGESLHMLLKAIETNCVVCIDADWGEGENYIFKNVGS